MLRGANCYETLGYYRGGDRSDGAAAASCCGGAAPLAGIIPVLYNYIGINSYAIRYGYSCHDSQYRVDVEVP